MIHSATGRRGLTILAAIVVATELWAASTHAAHIAKAGFRALTGPVYPVQDADVDGLAFFASPEALAEARKVIPRHATYSVVGPANRVVGAAIAFKFALLPRVYVEDPRRAQWIIAYQTHSESLGVRYSKEIGLGPAANVVKVER